VKARVRTSSGGGSIFGSSGLTVQAEVSLDDGAWGVEDAQVILMALTSSAAILTQAAMGQDPFTEDESPEEAELDSPLGEHPSLTEDGRVGSWPFESDDPADEVPPAPPLPDDQPTEIIDRPYVGRPVRDEPQA
jgi:hypothetical protein